jgi:hypothetical protein
MPKCGYSTTNFANYANVVSKLNAPVEANLPEFVSLSLVDTPDWFIGRVDPSVAILPDPSVLTCKNSGLWNIVAQYHVGPFVPSISPAPSPSPPADVYASLYRNGYELDQMAALATVEGDNYQTLTLAYTGKFYTGDFMQFGIFTQQLIGVLNAGIATSLYPSLSNRSGSSTPSLIVTMTRIGSC